MFAIGVNISIGGLELDFATKVEIRSSWKNLTDTAMIVLPRKLPLKKDPSKLVQEIIKKGDPVNIYMGYNGNSNQEFKGFVSNISTGTPIVIECEDYMWKLKQSSKLNKSWSNVNLQEVVAEIAPDVEADVVDFEMGAFRVSDVSAAQVLKEIKRSYGFKSYFVNGKLHVGFAYPLDTYKTVKYNFQKNVVDRSNKLEYRTANDLKLRVKATSYFQDKDPIVIELGDEDGALRTLSYYKMNEAELKKAAENDIESLRFDGFRGSFRAFHEPVVNHGDVALLTDNLYPDHNGAYFVDSVKTEMSTTVGIKRTVELGKVADTTVISDSNE